MSHTGSEWSRWDLHVHTPASHTHHFGGESEEAWERYIEDLEALPASVTVLGINDYLTVDGYERLRHAKDEEGRLPNIKLLLPVIELRLKMFGGQKQWVRVNYHVIFSDEVTPASIRNQFLAKLNASYEMKGHKWSGAPLPDQMREFAEVIRSSATDPQLGDDFALASAYFNVDIEQVRKVLSESSAFHGRFVEALGKQEWEALRWEGSTAEKLTIIERSDFLFTACKSEGEFHRGQRNLEDGTGNGRLLHCSDAHHLSDSAEPNRIGHCMTWIKADPCFEGLLLARHEYDSRVHVGSSPEQQERVEANPTKYLRSVRITAPSLASRAWFSGNELSLNPGLVAIVGNKGSGKSALTDAIALVADTKVEDHMSFLRDDRFRHQRLGLADKHRCEITWRSGDSETRYLNEHADRHKPERVRYLPQSYFERLCSEIGQDAQDEFEKQLKQVVFTWLPSDRRMGTESLDDLIRVTTGQWRERHRLRTMELKELNEQIAALERELQPDRLKDVRSQLAERQRELVAHDDRKPPDVPGDQPLPAAETDQQPDEIALLESRIAEIDTALQAAAVTLTGLRRRHQDLDDVGSRISNVQAYFESQLQTEAVDAVLQEEALTLDSIVTLSIDRQPLTEAAESLGSRIDDATTQTDDLRSERDDLSARRQALLNELDEERREQRDAEEAVQRWQTQRAGIVGAPGLEGTVTHLEASLEAVPFATAVLAEALKARTTLTREMFTDLRRLRNSYSDLFGPIQEYLEEEELLGEGLTMRVDALIRQDGFAQQFLEMIDRTKRALRADPWVMPVQVGVGSGRRGRADRGR